MNYIYILYSERNSSILFNDELDNGHSDALLPVEETTH
jgi:hypothetical protein